MTENYLFDWIVLKAPKLVKQIEQITFSPISHRHTSYVVHKIYLLYFLFLRTSQGLPRNCMSSCCLYQPGQAGTEYNVMFNQDCLN